MFSPILDIVGHLWRRLTSARGSASQASATEIASGLLAQLQFGSAYYASVVENHIVQVVNALRAAGIPLEPANLIWYMSPEELMRLSDELHPKACDSLRKYLAGLPERLSQLLVAVQGRLILKVG